MFEKNSKRQKKKKREEDETAQIKPSGHLTSADVNRCDKKQESAYDLTKNVDVRRCI